MILGNLCEQFNCLPGPGSLLEQDPIDLFSIVEARAGQRMKAIMEMDNGPDPSPELQQMWEEIIEAMGGDEISEVDG